MNGSSSASVAPNRSESSSEPSDPAQALRDRALNQGGVSGRSTHEPRNVLETWQFILGVLVVLIGGVVYFFVTVMGLQGRLADVDKKISVVENDQQHLKSSVVRVEQSVDRLNVIATDLAVLKATVSNGKK